VMQDDHSRVPVTTCPQNEGTVFCRQGADPKICTFRCDEAHDCPRGYACRFSGFCLSSWCVPE
jgi:hypothetical protein